MNSADGEERRDFRDAKEGSRQDFMTYVKWMMRERQENWDDFQTSVLGDRVSLNREGNIIW